MADYSQGKIYKITSPNCDEIYIGSTVRSLNDRFLEHKKDCKTKNNSSKIVIDKGDATIELIELFPCDSRTEIERREGEIQKSTLNCCNKVIAGRTPKEHYSDNVDKIKEQTAEYYKLNSDKAKQQKGEYYKLNADMLKQKSAEYYKLNADKVKQQQAEYRQRKKNASVI